MKDLKLLRTEPDSGEQLGCVDNSPTTYVPRLVRGIHHLPPTCRGLSAASNRWSSQNKWMQIFKNLVQEPDLEWAFIDGSIVKAHQHSAGLPRKFVCQDKALSGSGYKI